MLRVHHGKGDKYRETPVPRDLATTIRTVDDAGQGRCPDCGRAVTAVVTDGGPELAMGRRSRVEECGCGTTIIGYLGGGPCPDCGEVIYS